MPSVSFIAPTSIWFDEELLENKTKTLGNSPNSPDGAELPYSQLAQSSGPRWEDLAN